MNSYQEGINLGLKFAINYFLKPIKNLHNFEQIIEESFQKLTNELYTQELCK